LRFQSAEGVATIAKAAVRAQASKAVATLLAAAAACSGLQIEEALKIGGETSKPVFRDEALTASLASYRKPFDSESYLNKIQALLIS
jgi:hypothetical protein